MIQLREERKQRAIVVGQERYDFAQRNGYLNSGAMLAALPQFSIDGAVAECGIGDRLGQEWHENIGIIDGIDVGKIVEVRSRPPGKELGIRDSDRRFLPHVFTWVYKDYSVRILGWLYGYEGMHEKDSELHRQRWNENSYCWYNPPPYRPLDSLERILADETKVARIWAKHIEDEPRREEKRAIERARQRERAAREQATATEGDQRGEG